MDIVRLNVGGVIFQTTKSTLCSRDGFFKTMFSSAFAESDPKSEIFIDRNSQTFSVILDYLRHGELLIPPTLTKEQVQREVDFFFPPLPPQPPSSSYSRPSSSSSRRSSPRQHNSSRPNKHNSKKKEKVKEKKEEEDEECLCSDATRKRCRQYYSAYGPVNDMWKELFKREKEMKEKEEEEEEEEEEEGEEEEDYYPTAAAAARSLSARTQEKTPISPNIRPREENRRSGSGVAAGGGGSGYCGCNEYACIACYGEGSIKSSRRWY